MTYRRILFGRLPAIILFATTVLCRHPHSVAAPDSKPKPASTDHADVSPSALPRKDEPLPVRQDLNRDSLPDAPLPTAQQRMASEFLQIAIGNIATEFEPQWGPRPKTSHSKDPARLVGAAARPPTLGLS